VGTGRTNYKGKPYIGRVGLDAGIGFIREHKTANRRLELDFSCSRWDFKLKKTYQNNDPISDTFFIGYHKAWFFDMAIKSNLQIYKGDKFRLYLAAGLTVGLYIDYSRRKDDYLVATDALLSTGDWVKIDPITKMLIGMEYGLINEFPLRKNWILCVDILMLSKVPFELEGNYSFNFQQLRIGMRKTFCLN